MENSRSKIFNPSARASWRRAQSNIFGSVAFSTILVGMAVLMALLYFVSSSGRWLIPMRAASEAGFILAMQPIQWERTLYPHVLLTEVKPDSPVSKSGMQRYDVLIHSNNQSIQRPFDLWQGIANLSSNQNSLKIGWVPSAENLWELRTEPGATEDQLSIIINYIVPESPIAQAGLRINDQLLRISGLPLTGSRQAWEALVVAAQKNDQPQPLQVEVMREGKILHISLAIEKTAEITIDRNFWKAIWGFFTSFDSRYPEMAGLLSAIAGSIWLVALTGLISLPLGIGAAIYLEEYARKNWLTSLIQILISNLAGVPSVIYGIIGLEILARAFKMDRVLLVGALTMSLFILPLVIIAARESLRTIPDSIKQAAYGVGATRWQMVRHQVLPYAWAGIFTGVIIALSRALGEAALLIFLGAFQYLSFVPGPFDYFTVIPIQIFTWVTLPQDGYANIAAAAILTLLFILLLMNALAIFLRIKFQRRW
jgi:phosphate transport system permease protein